MKKPPVKLLDSLGKEIRKTGSGLIKAPSEEIAEAWSAWFKDSMPGHYGVLVVRGKEVNIYTQYVLDEEYIQLMDYILYFREKYSGFKNDDLEKKIMERIRLPEKEIMRIAGMKKKPFPWWKNKPKNAKGPNLEKGESLGSLKKKGIFEK